MTKTHKLKILPKYFKSVSDGTKKFEIRYNDRNYQVGDQIILREFIPETKLFTGKKIAGEITFITDFMQKDDYVVFNFKTF